MVSVLGVQLAKGGVVAAVNADAAYLEGEVGDYVIGDQFMTFAGSSVSVRLTYGAKDGIEVHLSDTQHDLSVWMFSGTGADLTAGRYENAMRAPFQGNGQPGLSVFGDGRGCNQVSGTFVIDEITFSGNEVTSLVARWEHHCEGLEPASFGAVSFGGSAPFRARSLSPHAVDFGQVSVGSQSAPHPTTLHNYGPAPLRVDQVTITGAGAAHFQIASDTCSGVTVAAGAQCTVDVRLAPTTSGQLQARLTFVDELVPTTTGQDVMLTGTAVSPAGEFTPLAPSRVLDTRIGLGAPTAPIGIDGSIDVQISGLGGVPSAGVAAVVMNVTAVNANRPTFITLWPTGSARPEVSTLNPPLGGAVANMATVRLGDSGRISAYNLDGTTDLLIDVVGYYADDNGPHGSRFVSVEPYRMFDTRVGDGIPRGRLAPRQTLNIDVNVINGHRLTGRRVTGLVLNLTVTQPTRPGFLTVYPNDVALPDSSHINFQSGQTVANLVTVRVPASGVVSFYNPHGNTHVIADVVGYYTDIFQGEGGRFVGLDPYRAFDSRWSDRPLHAAEYLWLTIAGRDDVPVTATSAVFNVTATQPTAFGFLSVVPDDVCQFPNTSSLNFAPGQTVPNSVISRLSGVTGCENATGAIDVLNPYGSTHVIIDVFGYFT